MPYPHQSVEPAKAFLARWTYEQLAILRDQTFGPALRMPEYCFGAYDVLLPALEEIVGPSREEETGKVLVVPTPWHAVLVLDSLQHHLCLQRRRAVFRGQSDSRWEISSSISRPGVDIPLENFKSQLFSDILRNMSFNNVTSLSPNFGTMTLTIPEDCYLAAAQHYGIKTDLIDFTPDPAVAVFFAAGSASPKPGTMASVYVLALETAIDGGYHIIIPPPFIERLHLQRGFFIKHSHSLPPPIDKDNGIIFEVQFPADFDFKPFRVIRRDVGVVDILQPNQDLDRVMSSVQKVIASERIHELSKEDYYRILEIESAELKRSLDRSQSFCSFYHNPMTMWAKYLDAFEDMLYWTAYYADEHSLSIDHETLSQIVRHNRPLIDSIVQLYKWMMSDPTFNCDEHRNAFINRLIELMMSNSTSKSILVPSSASDVGGM